MSDLVYVVTERSAAGETILGVFSTVEEARSVVPPVFNGCRLEDYRIHAQVLGAKPDPSTAWVVVLSRTGSVERCELAVT